MHFAQTHFSQVLQYRSVTVLLASISAFTAHHGTVLTVVFYESAESESRPKIARPATRHNN